MNEQTTIAANAWHRLLLPIVFGIAAAACYYKALSSQLKPVAFVQLTRSVPVSEKIGLADLRPIQIQGDTEFLKQGALLWSQVGRAIGAKAARQLHSGDLLILGDLESRDAAALRDGEERRTVTLPDNGTEYVGADIEVGSMVRAVIRTGEDTQQDYVGPFRVLEIERGRVKDGRVWVHKVVLGVPMTDSGRPDPEMARLDAAIQGARARNVERSLVEFVPFQPSTE